MGMRCARFNALLLCLSGASAFHMFDGWYEVDQTTCSSRRSTDTGWLEYHYVGELRSWEDARTRCPQINPEWTGLATVRQYVDYELLVETMKCGFDPAKNIVKGVWGVTLGFYSGAWIGLNSPTAIPSRIPSNGPWTPGTDWRWNNGLE